MTQSICPIALSRKLAIFRIEQEIKLNGSARACSRVWDAFEAAIIERNSHEEAVDIINYYAGQLKRRGKLEEMRRLYQHAVNKLTKHFGRHHNSTIAITFRLGKLLQRLRALPKAEKVYTQSLKGMRDGDPRGFCFSNELGVVYAERRKFLQAERELQKALCGFTTTWGADHMWTHTAAMNLGDVYQTQGKLNDATTLLRQSLLGLYKAIGPFHETVLDKASKLVNIYRHYTRRGKSIKAREECELSLAVFEQIFGPDHEETLYVVWDLAIMSKEQGRTTEFKKLMQRALAGLRNATGSG